MKTVFRYTTSSKVRDVCHELEADDKLVDAIANAIAITANSHAAYVEAEARAAEASAHASAFKLETFKQLASMAAAVAAAYGAGVDKGASGEAANGTDAPPLTKEALIIKDLLDESKYGLTAAQRDRIFGAWTCEGDLTSEGILTPAQVDILIDVCNGRAPTNALDALIDPNHANALTDVQFQKIKEALGTDFIKLMSFTALLKERADALEMRKKAATEATERRAKADAEAKERADYIPEPPSREALADGTIQYMNWAERIVQPGDTVSISVGVQGRHAGTGWPGLPETDTSFFGTAEDFKPRAISIPPGFGLTAWYSGSMNNFPCAPGAFVVPSEALGPGKPQRDYAISHKGLPCVVSLKNISDRQQAAWVKVVGEEVKDAAK